MHYENSMPIKYKDTIKKENYLIFPMQNMVMLCKVDSLVVNVIFHTSSKLYANVTSSKKCQVIKNWQFDMPGVIGMGVTQRPEELVQSSTVKNVGNRIQPMCFIGQILETSTEQFLFRNRRSNAIRKIIKISKFTKRTIEQIQTLQPYLQIDTEYILYPAYYDRKIIRTYYIKKMLNFNIFRMSNKKIRKFW